MKVLYKRREKDPKKKAGAECSDCGRHCSNPIWIGVEHPEEGVVEGPYGTCCAKKYKVGEDFEKARES